MKMKNIALLVVVLLLSGNILHAQSDTLNRINAQGKKYGYWKKYEKNVLMYEGRFANDVPVGTFTYYHANGKVKSTSNFINGVHKVQTILYHANGKKASEGIFVSQQKDGKWFYYNNSEKLIKEENYQKGINQGVWKTYSSETGLLLVEENYDKGNLHGVQKKYFTTGDLFTVINYIDGKKNGTAETYSHGNIVMSRGTYHNDMRDGAWDTFDYNGKVRKTVMYNHDKIEATYLYFYRGNSPQKMNQSTIAYIQKMDMRTINVVTYDGKIFTFTHALDEMLHWLDNMDFIPATPSIVVAYDNIKGYKVLSEYDSDEEDMMDERDNNITSLSDIGSSENNSFQIVVKLKKGPSFDVISRGDIAIWITSFFNTERPVEER